MLALGGCGGKEPANAGTPAPADRGHACLYFWKGEDIRTPLRIIFGEGNILGWEVPAETAGNPGLDAGALLEANPPVTMRLPLFPENELISFDFGDAERVTDCTLEAYPVGEQGTLMFSSRVDHTVPLRIDGTWISFEVQPSTDWGLSSSFDPDAAYWPQGYILRCRVNGWEKVYVFRLGVLIPKPELVDLIDEMKPQNPDGFWNLAPFTLVEAKSDQRSMGGGWYLMTDAERLELMELLKPETWSIVTNPEARGMEGALSLATLGGVYLAMDGGNRDGSVAISIYNRYKEEHFYYTAPKEVLTAFQSFVFRMGDKVFPERLGAQ